MGLRKKAHACCTSRSFTDLLRFLFPECSVTICILIHLKITFITMWLASCIVVMVLALGSNFAVSFRLIPSGPFQHRRPLFSTTVNDKQEVTEYFNNEGFNRWNKIYSDSNEVNKVQLDIRTGHQQTIDKVLGWIANENNSGKTVCDAGCGVGSLALPMAKKFKKVFASDISSSMTQEAAARAKAAKLNNLAFEVRDMEALKGSYDTVTCIDVMIHYPTDKVQSFERCFSYLVSLCVFISHLVRCTVL